MKAGSFVINDESCQFAALVTESAKERMGGLLTQPHLPRGTGFWIRPCNSVHTFFMKYALDLIYLDRNNRVVKLVEGVVPWRMSQCFTAHSVIELNAGDSRALHIAKGDVLTWKE